MAMENLTVRSLWFLDFFYLFIIFSAFSFIEKLS